MKVQLTCKNCGEVYYRTPSAAKNSNYCRNACRAKARGDVMLSDLTGQRFGRLAVIERAPNKGEQVMWLCRCDCGNEVTTRAGSLKHGRANSCGCLSREIHKKTAALSFTKPIEPGARFNRFIVLSESGKKRGYITYLCRCDCGVEKIVKSGDLRNGTTKSCGCYNADRWRALNLTHGLSGTKEYNHARRVKRRYSDNGWTSDMTKALFSLQPVCVVCGSDKELAVDHVIPVTKGGPLIPGNAVRLCKSCNSAKNNKLLSGLPPAMAEKISNAAYEFSQYWKSVEEIMSSP